MNVSEFKVQNNQCTSDSVSEPIIFYTEVPNVSNLKIVFYTRLHLYYFVFPAPSRDIQRNCKYNILHGRMVNSIIELEILLQRYIYPYSSS